MAQSEPARSAAPPSDSSQAGRPVGDRRQVARSSPPSSPSGWSSSSACSTQGACGGRRHRGVPRAWRSSPSTATRRAVPLKYLLPGLLFLVALQVWPIAYTAATAFTNYGDGHRVSKQECDRRPSSPTPCRRCQGAPRYQPDAWRSRRAPTRSTGDARSSCSPTRRARPQGRHGQGSGGPARRRASRRRPPARSPRPPATRSSTPGRSTPAARTSTPSPCPRATAAGSRASASARPSRASRP